MEDDKILLMKAVEIAGNGMLEGGGPFGAVVVRNGIVISGEYNRVVLANDPTAHAEILAIRRAAEELKTHDLSDCTLYSSCEPCPMCLGAIYWADIKKVVFDCDRKDAEAAGFTDRMIYEEIMMEPERRKVSFIRIPGAGGKEVFNRWNGMVNKIRY